MNPINAFLDKPVLTVMVKLLDDEIITSTVTLYKAVKSCLEELRDKEIKKLLHDNIVDDSAGGIYIHGEDSKPFYVGFVSIVKAMEAGDELSAKAEHQFKNDCTSIRNYIRCTYGF